MYIVQYTIIIEKTCRISLDIDARWWLMDHVSHQRVKRAQRESEATKIPRACQRRSSNDLTNLNDNVAYKDEESLCLNGMR